MIEPLETRIAPASLANNVLTYTDVDGDLVTVKTTVGTFVLANTSGGGSDTFTFSLPDGRGHQQLQLIDLHNGGFDGADLTITVAKKPGGDGLANVGYINSSGHPLGIVTIPGDLGRIAAGGSDDAIEKVSVRSMGLYGDATQAAGGNLLSSITGGVGTFAVTTDVKDANIVVSQGGILTHPIGTLAIGGSLIGGAGTASGSFYSDAGYGSIKIGGNIIGGTGNSSGLIYTLSTVGPAHIGAVTIGGSVIGGSSGVSGSIINPTGDLGAVKIGGNLAAGLGDLSGQIKAKTNITSMAIGGSVIGGAGKFTDSTSGGQIYAGGDLGPVTIAHDLTGGAGDYSGAIYAHGLGTVTIGGSILGGGGMQSGAVAAFAAMGSLKIGHDVAGGSGNSSGFITATSITSIAIGGSLIGGYLPGSLNTGFISAGSTIGPITIGHDVIGGAVANSGIIFANDLLTSLSIGGSLFGGSASFTGQIHAGNIGSVTIGRDLQGGSISGAQASLLDSGAIIADGHLGSVTIGGSVRAGIDNSSGGALLESATIRAGRDIGSLTVKGSLAGNHTGTDLSLVTISALAAVTPGDKTDLAIGKISITGRVELTQILAGYLSDGTAQRTLTPKNPDASIGPVTVGGDWVASSLAAGAMNSGGLARLGDANDAKISGSGTSTDTARVASIASISVTGRVIGSIAGAATENFGFVSEQIGSLKVGGVGMAMQLGPGNDQAALGHLFNMNLHEIGAALNHLAFAEQAHLVGKSTVTFSDGEGDHVTVTLSKPLLTAANVNNVFQFSGGTVDDGVPMGRLLNAINLTALDPVLAKGIGVTVTALRKSLTASGDPTHIFSDGLGDVGRINAVGLDVGAISISGDLGVIDAGSGSATVAAVASLKVRTLGRYGTTTQSAAPVPDLFTNLNGKLGSLTVTADLKDANILVQQMSGTNAKIGAVTIGGSVLGGTVTSFNGTGAVRIGGDIVGGASAGTGAIQAIGGLTSITVGGSLFGGLAGITGTVRASSGGIGALKIGGNLIAGLGGNDGNIFANKSYASVTVGGSLFGGLFNSAQINSFGTIGNVSIAHSLIGGSGASSGLLTGTGAMKNITVGGSLIGRSAGTAGTIFVGGTAGVVKIGHDILGGSGADSGKYEADGLTTSIAVGGSLVGGSTVRAGSIVADGGSGLVKIGHDIVGGAAPKTGALSVGGAFSGGVFASPATPVTVGGSLIGGSGGNSTAGSGEIRALGDFGAISIGHDVLGGSISGSAGDSTSSGFIISYNGRIASVTLGGSIISGLDASNGGNLLTNASIRAAQDIGLFTVHGSIVGRASANGDTPVVIIALGQLRPTATKDLAMGSVTVSGLMSLVKIEAGFWGRTDDGLNADAQIGAVKVTGNWLASSLVAGVENYGGDMTPYDADDNLNFGDTNDHLINSALSSIARIASITIGGIVAGSAPGRHYGFSAHTIGAFKTAGFTALLHPTVPTEIIELSPTTGDVTVREV